MRGIETAYRFAAVDPPNFSWRGPHAALQWYPLAAGAREEEKLMNFLKVAALPPVTRSMRFAEVYLERGELVIS